MKLSKAQQTIVNERDGQILVIAVPGSGKTTVLQERANAMIRAGVKPEEILIVTYSDAAVQDMQRRFHKAYGDSPIKIITIHSFCCEIIKHAWHEDELTVVTETEQLNFFKDQVRKRMHVPENGVDNKARQIISSISKARNGEGEFRKLNKVVRDMYVDYRAWKSDWERYNGAKKLDYDDMISTALDIISYSYAECEYWRKKYKYFCIDEFQDSNVMQLDLFWNLTEPDGNIFVVGDDDQSVYGFRGSNPQIMQHFIDRYPNCKQFFLDRNHRSLPDIVNAAAKLIGHNQKRISKSFKTWRIQEGMNSFKTKNCPNYTDMIDSMIGDIKTLCSSRGMLYKDMAILYRTNRQILPVISELLRTNMPFKCEGEIPDIHQEVFYKDIKAYYKLTTDPDIKTLLSVLNHPKRNLNERDFGNCELSKEVFIERLQERGYYDIVLADKISAVEQLFNLIEKLKGLKPEAFVRCFLTSEYMDWLIERTPLHPNAVQIMMDYVIREASGYDYMQDWIDSFKSYTERLKAVGENKDAITLSTYHSAKGLEWKQIFLIDVNDGVTPYATATDDVGLEEERRLFYVALTRVRDRVNLYVTGEPSPYLAEMGLPSNEEKECPRQELASFE